MCSLELVVNSLLVAAVTVVATAPASAEPKVAISPRTKTVVVNDDAWGIPAFKMEIPDNWVFEGALLRDPYCGGAPIVAIRLTSPDGLAGYQMLPTFIWHSSDDPSYVKTFHQGHCKVMDPLTPAEFLSYVVPSIRPDPTIGAIGPTMDARAVDDEIQQYNRRNQAAHLPGSEEGGAVRSLIEYQLHGHAIEENIRIVLHTFKTSVGPYGGPKHTTWGTTANVTGLRAPKGQLQDVGKALTPAIQSVSFTPEWTSRQMKKMAQDQQRSMDLIKKQGEAISARLKRNHELYMQQSRDSFEKSQAADRERTDAMHRSAVAWTLYAGDEQLVRNPQTHEVSRTTNQYGQYGAQDATSGDIMMSNNPNFDPSYYTRGQWTQLENVDPMKP